MSKSGPAGPVQVGDPVSYTITVTNNGPDASTGWTLTDPIPAGLANASTSTPGCSVAGGVLTCNGGALAAGASTTITLTGTAGPGATSITNTVVVDGNEPDPVPGNDTDTVTTPIAAPPAQVDLEVDKTGPASVQAGDPLTYNITVTNKGPNASTGWTLTDQLPAGLLNPSTSTPGCSIVGGVLSCTGGPLAAGASTVITVSGTAASTGVTSLTNTVVVDGNEPDPVPGNNTDTITTPITPGQSVDLAVDKTGPASAKVGDTVTYTIKVTNNGPNPSSGWTLTDPIPAGLLNVSTPTPGCTTAGGQLTCTGGALAAGATTTITLTGTAGPGFTGITNTVVVDGNEPDPVPGNNTDTVTTPVTVRQADLSVNKTGPASAKVGDTVTYTLTVTNDGPDASTGWTLTDPIPTGLVNPSTPTPGCSIAGGVLTCNGGPLAAGASATITLTGTAGPGITSVTNSATIDGDDPDPDPGNNNDTVTTPITPGAVDLSLQKSGPTSVRSGENVTYTIRITNNGPSTSTGWRLTDQIPAGLLNATTNTPGCGIGGGVLTCNGGPLAAGASTTVTLTGTAGPGITSISNSAVVDGNEPDPNPNNNDDTVTTPVLPPVNQGADLSVDKSGPDTASVGDRVTYTIRVTNNGPGTATNWSLTDTIPAGLRNPSTSTAGCVISSNVLTCTGAELAPGASRTITLTGIVDQGARLVENTAIVDSDTTDPVPGNNSDTTSTTVKPKPKPHEPKPHEPKPHEPKPHEPKPHEPKQRSLQILKRMDGPVKVNPGQRVDYTITVRNTGDVAYTSASPARFTDNLAGLLDDANYNHDAEATVGDVSYSAPSLSWSGALQPGQTATITFSVTVKSRPFGDLKLENKVVSNSPGANCAPGSDDAKCETTGKVIAPDKERPRAAGLQGLNNSEVDKFPRPAGEMTDKESMNSTQQ